MGVDEGALPGAQDGARAGEGEAGGVGRASSGDFQHTLFHRQGGVVSFIHYFLRIPAEDNIVFQQEDAAIEGGIRAEVVVPAGGKMRIFSLVEFAAEDDPLFRGKRQIGRIK